MAFSISIGIMLWNCAETLELPDSSTVPGYIICFNTYLSNNNYLKLLLSSATSSTHLFIVMQKCTDASYCVYAKQWQMSEDPPVLEESEPIFLDQAGWVHTCLEFDHVNSDVTIYFNGKLVDGLKWSITQAFKPEKVVINWINPGDEERSNGYYSPTGYAAHSHVFPERFTMFNIFSRYLTKSNWNGY